MGGDDKKEIKEGIYCCVEEEDRCDDDVLTRDICQGVRALLGEEGEVVEEEAFTEEEVVVGVVEEEVEVMMEVEGEVSVVVAVSTGELSRSHFRVFRMLQQIMWMGRGGGICLVNLKVLLSLLLVNDVGGCISFKTLIEEFLTNH